MVGKCILAPDINKCSFFIVEKEGCNNKNKVCGFYRDIVHEKETLNIKEPKWFEKYYK